MPQRIIVAVTGASGIPYAHRLIRTLTALSDLELHGIVSDAARQVCRYEMDLDPAELTTGFHFLHDASNIAAAPASGSWEHHGMIVCPCSMSTLAAIATGVGSNLIHRAADVTIKERRPLILVPRETPLSDIHLENMLRVRRAGAVIMPPCPGFYHRPQTLDDLIAQFVGRILEQLHLPHTQYRRWDGPPTSS